MTTLMPDYKIKSLIENSPISPEQKRFLLQFMTLKGVNMEFFDTFDRYLKDAVKENSEKYPEVMEKIEKIERLQRELDDKTTMEKEEIEKMLERKLNGIDPLDLKSKKVIWEEYYDTLDELGERYDEKLKDILSK